MRVGYEALRARLLQDGYEALQLGRRIGSLEVCS